MGEIQDLGTDLREQPHIDDGVFATTDEKRIVVGESKRRHLFKMRIPRAQLLSRGNIPQKNLACAEPIQNEARRNKRIKNTE